MPALVKRRVGSEGGGVRGGGGEKGGGGGGGGGGEEGVGVGLGEGGEVGNECRPDFGQGPLCWSGWSGRLGRVTTEGSTADCYW